MHNKHQKKLHTTPSRMKNLAEGDKVCGGISVGTRMWANAQPDGRPTEHRWHPLFNAAKFG